VILASSGLEILAPRFGNRDSEFRSEWLITSIGSADTRRIGYGMFCEWVPGAPACPGAASLPCFRPVSPEDSLFLPKIPFFCRAVATP
jgi:hypothetical protein